MAKHLHLPDAGGLMRPESASQPVGPAKPMANPGIITSIDRNLRRLEDQVDQPAPRRPMWKRIVLPMLGLVMVLVGVCFILTPIPLAVLIIGGFPLLCCFHPRIESRARTWMTGRLEVLRAWVRSWRPPRTR